MKKLKKNESCPSKLANFNRGFTFYEELRPYLVSYQTSTVYAMGISLLSKYGIKGFLNKFQGKEIDSESVSNFTITHMQKMQPVAYEVESNSHELIFLLTDMIRSIGEQNGTEQKNYK